MSDTGGCEGVSALVQLDGYTVPARQQMTRTSRGFGSPTDALSSFLPHNLFAMSPRIEFLGNLPVTRVDDGGRRRGVATTVRIDVERMEKALKGERSLIPSGLNSKQIVEFLNNAAKKRA